MRRATYSGLVLIVVGLGVNQWTLAPLADDGHVDSPYGMLVLLLFQLPVTLAGLVILRRPRLGSLSVGWKPVILIASLAYSIVLADQILRFFPKYWPRPRVFVGEFDNREGEHFIFDPQTGWRMRPNIEFRYRTGDHWNRIRSNDQGFRSERNFSSSASGIRIALVGDSFTMGNGVEVEQTFAALLEERIGENVAVYNYGMTGFGVDQMWMTVRHDALPLKPALIVVAFIDADLDRSLTAYRRRFNKPTFVLEYGTLRPQTITDRPGSLVRFLEEHSSIWTAFTMSSKQIGYSYRFGDWWLLNEAIFKAVIADCQDAGTSLLFVRLPMKSWVEFLNLDRLMEAERANFLDLGSPAARPDYNVHFRNDGHMNAVGHSFVANELLRRIRRERMLPLAADDSKTN